jgi:hypothetical protein
MRVVHSFSVLQIYISLRQHSCRGVAKIHDILLLRKITLSVSTRRQFYLCTNNVVQTALDSLAYILHFFNNFWTASRLVCSLCEAMPGSLAVANTVVESANVAVVDSIDFGGFEVSSNYSIIIVPGQGLALHTHSLIRIVWRQFQNTRIYFQSTYNIS